MRKILGLGFVGILLSVLCVMPVSAHGHHSRQAACGTDQDRLCEVCTETDCVQKGWHVHDGSIYCGYDHEEGYCDGSCDTVRTCTIEKCTEKGHHIHDSREYCGYEHESGYCDGTCGSVTVCTVDGCRETGRHTHEGEIYCGYDHTSGYCNGTCEQSESSQVRGHGRHHGHHGKT